MELVSAESQRPSKCLGCRDAALSFSRSTIVGKGEVSQQPRQPLGGPLTTRAHAAVDSACGRDRELHIAESVKYCTMLQGRWSNQCMMCLHRPDHLFPAGCWAVLELIGRLPQRLLHTIVQLITAYPIVFRRSVLDARNRILGRNKYNLSHRPHPLTPEASYFTLIPNPHFSLLPLYCICFFFSGTCSCI